MPTVPDKYREQPIYHLVYAELITAARFRGTVTYQEIAQMMGLPLTGHHMSNELGHILGEISEDEHTHGRPMLSAVAVGVDGMPGPGFFSLARALGKLLDGSASEERGFWESERAAVYEAWRRRLGNVTG